MSESTPAAIARRADGHIAPWPCRSSQEKVGYPERVGRTEIASAAEQRFEEPIVARQCKPHSILRRKKRACEAVFGRGKPKAPV